MSLSAESGKTLSTKSLLPDRGIIAISGADAREFLQGLITNDIHTVSGNTALFAALLSPQGRFLYDFFIVEHEGKLLLDIDKAQIPELVKRLNMYKLRSQVDIAEIPELQVAAEWGNKKDVISAQAEILAKTPAFAGVTKYQDPRLPELGVRVISKDIEAADNGSYEKHRLSLGVPEGSKDLTKDRSLPMEWGYDKLNAIDFEKGCYVGQEVTARSKHRATLHKMIHQVKAKTALPANGTIIKANGREVGRMSSSLDTIGLASLNLEAVSSGQKLYVNDIEIQAKLPDWIKVNNS